MRPTSAYDALLAEGRRISGGVRIGRPGRSRGYWWMYVPAQAVRLRYAITVTGREHLAPGPAILVGNHVSLMDPVLAGVTSRHRLAFFTKIEAYEAPGAAFFRWAGQIPLRRGDEESTRWALEMSHEVLQLGARLGIYPEGTRSPDGHTLHRLHRRVLVPILAANPGVPVHAMAIRYGLRRRGRIPVDLHVSPALPLDAESMGADDLTEAVRAALVSSGGLEYRHEFGQRVKARRDQGREVEGS